MLTLDALRAAAAAFESEVVAIPGLPAPARFRDIPGAARDQLTRFFHEAGEGAASRTWEYKRLVVALSLCDDAGQRLIPDAEIEQVLGAFGGATLDAMFNAAAKVSRLLPASVEEAEKNSEAGQS